MSCRSNVSGVGSNTGRRRGGGLDRRGGDLRGFSVLRGDGRCTVFGCGVGEPRYTRGSTMMIGRGLHGTGVPPGAAVCAAAEAASAAVNANALSKAASGFTAL